MKIALIGAGKGVETYAMRYAAAGHEVLMAWKETDRKKINPELTYIDGIRMCGIEEAGELADFIVLATVPEDVREVAYWLGDVRKKIIVDATSNFYFKDDHVNSFMAIKAITGSIHVVKLFSTRGYEKLLKPLFGHEETQIMMAGDSKKSKEMAKIISEDLGIYTFFDLGGNEAIPLFNELTHGWHKLAIAQDKTVIATTPVRI